MAKIALKTLCVYKMRGSQVPSINMADASSNPAKTSITISLRTFKKHKNSLVQKDSAGTKTNKGTINHQQPRYEAVNFPTTSIDRNQASVMSLRAVTPSLLHHLYHNFKNRPCVLHVAVQSCPSPFIIFYSFVLLFQQTNCS